MQIRQLTYPFNIDTLYVYIIILMLHVYISIWTQTITIMIIDKLLTDKILIELLH